MTEVFLPTPGRDAMTRDGRRVAVEEDGGLSIGRYDEPTGLIEVRLGPGAWYCLFNAELFAAAETLRQIGDAMEGK